MIIVSCRAHIVATGNYKTGASAKKKMTAAPWKLYCSLVCTMQSLVNERSVSAPHTSNSLNLSDFTSTVIMEGCVRGPDLELWYALLHERGDSLMHKVVPLRRFAALPYLYMWKNKSWTLHRCWLSQREQAAERFVPDAASESTAAVVQGALISTVGLYAFTVCVWVSVCLRSLMSGSTQCPPGVRHHTAVVYWEILLPVIHTYMLAFYTLHSLRGHSVSALNFYSESPGPEKVWNADLLLHFLIRSFKKADVLS